MNATGLKVGDTLRDNDPRTNNRTVKVTGIGDDFVECASGPRKVRIALARIHDDGKPRKSGFSLERNGA